MASIRLQIGPIVGLPPLTWTDETGSQHPLSRLRLRTQVHGVDGPTSTKRQTNLITAIIDTGAPISIIPYSIWKSWEAVGFRGLHHPANPHVVQGIVGGSTYAAWIGSVWLAASDLEGRVMPPARVIAFFQNTACKSPGTILLGLGHGILEGRRLLREPIFDPSEADSPHYSPNHQQRWWLTDH